MLLFGICITVDSLNPALIKFLSDLLSVPNMKLVAEIESRIFLSKYDLFSEDYFKQLLLTGDGDTPTNIVIVTRSEMTSTAPGNIIYEITDREKVEFTDKYWFTLKVKNTYVHVYCREEDKLKMQYLNLLLKQAEFVLLDQ